MKKQHFTNRELRYFRTQAENQYESMRGARFYRNVDFLVYVLTVVLLALGIRAFLMEPIRVDGSSMVPTLHDGEHMFVEKVSYWFKKPARGDIIICFYPGYTESCVKRVVGLPGETVSLEDGRVLVNGVPLIENSYWQDDIMGDMQPVTVGKRELFVMGDNRNGSKDSRSASVGCIPYCKVEGRVRAVIWPVGHMRRFLDLTYPPLIA